MRVFNRLFDNASVFVMRGPSCHGRGLDTYSVQAVPQAVKVGGSSPRVSRKAAGKL